MSTQYRFTFTYKDGSTYTGTVVDDGTFGYTAGKTIQTPYGVYSVDSALGAVSLAAGTVSVSLYHDVTTGADYVPALYASGQTQRGGLGDEYDSVANAAGSFVFGNGGQYKANLASTGGGGPLTLYDFTFTYADGSFYSGTVFDDGTFGYSNGQKLYTPYGVYAITAHSGAIDPGLSKSVGAVRTTSYHDATTAITYTTANAKSAGGGRGLGTETDSVTPPGGSALIFGDGGKYAALPRGETQFTFTFTYADGSSYTGTVEDNGTYGYAVGQTINTAHGSYAVTAATPVTGYYSRPIGTVLISGYTDISTGFYSPVYGFNGIAAGANGLGSEHDFIDENNGRKAFGGGGEQEARQYGTTLFSFRFTYADGSYYYGSVADDGRYGYYQGQTITTADGAYTFYYYAAATQLAPGRVSVSLYRDASSNTTYTPYYSTIGQASGSGGLGSEYDFTNGANGYQTFGQGGAYEARQSGSTLYDFIFRYTDGSQYQGVVADNGNFGTFVGERISSSGGSYYVYGKSGGTALAAGTVVVSSYYDISTKNNYIPTLGSQGKSDGTAGLGSEQDYTDGAAGHLAFGLAGEYEARQGGNPLYAFKFTYLDGSDYYGTVSDDGSYGYAVGQVIPTAYGSYRLYASAGYSSQPGGTVHISRYDDITSNASYVPELYAQGKTSGDAGLGFEVDYTHGASGDVGFGIGGEYEARQAPNTLYEFSFTYLDGSYYYGTVSDDGGFGYHVGDTIPSPYGAYRIYGSEGYTTEAGGDVSIAAYHDVYTGQSYVPVLTAQGQFDGDGGLGFEHDTVVSVLGAQDFGDNGALEAVQAPYTVFSFYFQYPDGSFYYGTVSDPSYTYTAGQTITAQHGFYHIYGATGITADAPGTVRVSKYYDISSHAFFIPFNYASGIEAGTNDLGSEIDSTSGDGGLQKFGAGGRYEARQDATTLYDFRFDYNDGSYYLGKVADDGTYGYHVDDTIETHYGVFHITGDEGATTLTPGKVYLTLYYDVYSDLYPDSSNPSPLYTPVRYSLGEIAGYKGLGSEEDYTHAGVYRLFGYGGTAESKNYYTHEYPLTLPYPPPRTPPGGSSPQALISKLAATQGEAALSSGSTTLFSFTFTYADGSRYSGTVADDGSLGYAVGQTIAGTGGSYAITGSLGATDATPGTVSVTSYLDITTGLVSTPDLFATGQNAGAAGLGSEQDSIGGNHGTLPFGLGGADEAKQGIPLFGFSFTYTDGSVYLGTVADDGSLGYAVGQTITTAYGSYLITAAAGTTGRPAGSVAVGTYTDVTTGATYAPDGAPASIGAMAVVGSAGLGSETGTITGPAGTQSFGQGGALEARLSIASFRFQFTYADGSFYQGTVADDGSLGYTVGQVITGTGGHYTITGAAGPTAAASGTVSVTLYRDALSNQSFAPDLTSSGTPDGTGGLGSEQDTISAGGVVHEFGQGGTLEAGSAIAVYAYRFDYPDGSFYQGTVTDDGSLGYKAGQTIATAHGTYTITGRNPDTTFHDSGIVTVARYVDATTGLGFTPDAGSVTGTAGLGSEKGTITGNQGTRPFGQGGALEASQAAKVFDFTFTYADGSAYTGTVADDGRYGYAANETIKTKHGAYHIGGSSATTSSRAGAVSVSRYLDAASGGSFIPLATSAGQDDGSAGLGSELDSVTSPAGVEAFGQGGAHEANAGAPCYRSGTAILTDRGEVAVENLRVGDFILTIEGEVLPILWLGHRTSYCARHPNPQSIWPVLIRHNAFAEGVPARDLFVSPGHSVYIEGVLIQAESLINGATILQVQVPRVTYWHVELAEHSIIFAEGLPAESYLDTGNRCGFINGGAYIEAHPDFRPKHWAQTCAPLVFDGPQMQAAKASLLARAAELGHQITHEDDLHIIADGERYDPIRLSNARAAFLMPAGCESIMLVSRTFIPSQINTQSRDGRTLGARLQRVQIDGTEIPMDSDAAFGPGWHHHEPHENSNGARWTTGLTPIASSTRLVMIDFAGRGYYWTNKESAEIEKPKQMAVGRE